MVSFRRSFTITLTEILLVLLMASVAPSAAGQGRGLRPTLQAPGQVQPGQQAPAPPALPPIAPESPPISSKQKKDLLKRNFEEMKHQADELAVLAKSLQQDLDKSNANVLSLAVVEKADKIEKLAKKIKGTAKGL